MAIPDFQTLMLPLLEVASDGSAYSIHEAVQQLAEKFQLSEEEIQELLPSGQQPIFYNRVGWARTYLKKAKLLEDPKRGTSESRNAEKIYWKPSQIELT